MRLRFTLFIFLFASIQCYAQQQRSALFLGNSYTASNDLPGLIKQIAESQGNTFTFQKNTPGGHTLWGHAQNATSLDLVENASYDYLVLQGQSGELGFPNDGDAKFRASNFKAAEHLKHLSYLRDTCHQTLLFMTWGYNNSPQQYADMQSTVSANYEDLAHALGSGVAPVGEAWRYVIENYPNIPLHSQDQSHPNIAGSYLAACVFYASMFQENPEGVWSPQGISAAEALILQQVAQSTVTGDLPRWNLQPFSALCSSASYPHHNTHWEAVNFPDTAHIEHIQFPSDQTGYVRCEFPYSLLVTHDEGDSWSKVEVPTNGYRFAVHFITDSIGFLATGQHWIDSTTIDSSGMQGPTADQLLFPRVYKTTDAGQSWLELPVDAQAVGIHFNGFLFGTIMNDLHLHFDSEQRGTVVYSHINLQKDTLFSITTFDGGQQWSFATTKLKQVFPTVQLRSADTLYAASHLSSFQHFGNKMAWWRSTNGGMDWQAADSIALGCCTNPGGQFVQVMHPGSNGMFVANNLASPYVLRSLENELGWDTAGQAPFLGSLIDLEEVAPGVLFGLFENALSHRIGLSKDGGETWKLDSYVNDNLIDLAQTSEYLYMGIRLGVMLRRKLAANPTRVSDVLPANASLKVFPNPATNVLYIQLSEDHEGFPLPFAIYDVAGKQLEQTTIVSPITKLSIDRLAPGVYFYHCPFLSNATGKFIVR